MLVFPGPGSATGEDLVELHCHGGRAVTGAVIDAVLARPGVRLAEPGEFTRRALEHGRIDLAQAEGLADLLEAETEGQRRAALAASEGRVSKVVRGWLDRVAMLAAQLEATLDFAEEGDLDGEAVLLRRVREGADALRGEISDVLSAPPVERLRDGVRVVIGGPPNSGKSTLLNLLSEREAAIVSPYAGTTRDRIEAPVRRNGVAYVLTDTAGLTDAVDPVERVGVALADDAIASADVLVWLADTSPPRADAIWVHARADLPERQVLPAGRSLATRHDRPQSIDQLWGMIDARARALLPSANDLPLKRQQREACEDVADNLVLTADPLIAAEQLRVAAASLGRLTGVNATETMLDSLFQRFCLGK